METRGHGDSTSTTSSPSAIGSSSRTAPSRTRFAALSTSFSHFPVSVVRVCRFFDVSLKFFEICRFSKQTSALKGVLSGDSSLSFTASSTILAYFYVLTLLHSAWLTHIKVHTCAALDSGEVASVAKKRRKDAVSSTVPHRTGTGGIPAIPKQRTPFRALE